MLRGGNQIFPEYEFSPRF